MCGLFLPAFASMGREGVIERLTINVLRMIRQVSPDRSRQICVHAIRHIRFSQTGRRRDFDPNQGRRPPVAAY